MNCFSLSDLNQIEGALAGMTEHNKELTQRYHREMALRKKYHNELIDLKGNIRVFCRVRPIIKEDGTGILAKSVVSFDTEDDGILSLSNKGRTTSYEADKVFTAESTQEQVSSTFVFLLGMFQASFKKLNQEVLKTNHLQTCYSQQQQKYGSQICFLLKCQNF